MTEKIVDWDVKPQHKQTKIVKSIMNFTKHTCTEIYDAFQQTRFWLKCRFTGLWLPYACWKVGSIPAFHSVQQNINSLLKYFPYVSICICLYLRMIKWRCALPQKNLTEGISAYAYNFSVVVKRGAWKIKKINGKKGGLAPRSQSILMPEKEMEIIFVTPPHGFINEILTPG